MQHFSFRIGIDCRLAGQRHAGIGRYIENLITRLPELAPEVEWVLFFHDQQQADEIFSKDSAGKLPENIRIVLTPIKHYSIQEQVKLPGLFAKESLDLLHVPHFNIPLKYQGKLVVTIHDLLWHEYKGVAVTTLPMWQYHLKYTAYRWVVSQAVKKAAAILVPAETIRKAVVSYYPDAAAKIHVTKEGIERQFRKDEGKLIGRSMAKSVAKNLPAKPKQKTLIYVGSLYPHKNIQVVIDALALLPDYKLVLVGTRNVFQAQVAEYVKKKNLDAQVEFVGYLSDAELAERFETATALVQPSLSEGFGLTGVEAMAAGVPVLASDIPIFHEIYQSAAFYFDPFSAEAFVSALRKLEATNQAELVRNGKAVAAQYSWDEMAKETLAVYKGVVAGKKVQHETSL